MFFTNNYWFLLTNQVESDKLAKTRLTNALQIDLSNATVNDAAVALGWQSIWDTNKPDKRLSYPRPVGIESAK